MSLMGAGKRGLGGGWEGEQEEEEGLKEKHEGRGRRMQK